MYERQEINKKQFRCFGYYDCRFYVRPNKSL